MEIKSYAIVNASGVTRTQNTLKLMDFTGTPVSSIQYGFNTAQEVETAFPDFFSSDVSMFTGDAQQAARLVALGFRNVILMDDGGRFELTNGSVFARNGNKLVINNIIADSDMFTPDVSNTSTLLSLPNFSVWRDASSAYRYRITINLNDFKFSIRFHSAWNTALPIADYQAVFEGAQDESHDYESGGTSGPGGGDGTFSFESTDIPFSPLPNIGAYDTGFITLYKPSTADLKSLASYMWSGSFDVDNLRKLFADPMSAILGLSIIPCSESHPATESAELKVGNVSTGLSMPRCTEQYFIVNCGRIDIPAKWGAYLDYAPYSKLTLYLPYIGYVPVSPDDCMRGSIEIQYKIDILSGSCVVEVRCVSNRGVDAHVLYTFNGNCGCACPVTNGQYTNGAVGILHGAAAINQAITSGNILGGIEDVANTAISMVKPDITRSGDFGGSAGVLGNQYPYLILTIPRMCTPEKQSTYIGYPSFITKIIGSITGYAEMKVTHLEGMSCTDDEANEIIEMLERGVIL